MTNKEAIEILKRIYPDGAYSPTERQRLKAINMAISALANTQRMTEALRTEYEKGRYDMREEMMKEAVDAKCLLLPPPDLFKVLLCPQITRKLGKGAIVKLIIVKEDNYAI